MIIIIIIFLIKKTKIENLQMVLYLDFIENYPLATKCRPPDNNLV